MERSLQPKLRFSSLITTDMIGVDVTAPSVLGVQCMVQLWQQQAPAAAT